MTATVTRRSITPSVYRDVLSSGTCAYCTSTLVDTLEVDHIIPFSRGGSDDRENLVAACWRCNLEKSDLTPDEWASQRQAHGHPWPIPNPFATAAAIVREWPGEFPTGTWTAELHTAAHAAVIRGRSAGFDAKSEAAALAELAGGAA